jgi:hypothetical protein
LAQMGRQLPVNREGHRRQHNLMTHDRHLFTLSQGI